MSTLNFGIFVNEIFFHSIKKYLSNCLLPSNHRHVYGMMTVFSLSHSLRIHSLNILISRKAFSHFNLLFKKLRTFYEYIDHYSLSEVSSCLFLLFSLDRVAINFKGILFIEGDYL